MLRRMSKESPPPIDELAEVTLRRPGPVTPTGPGPYGQRMGPYFSRPMGPEFMRRSCTFVAEAGWRKSSGGKDAKERQNLALKVRQKAAELGAEDDGPKAAGRVQRLVGNVAGNLKSWSSSEDVRQSMMGAFNRTVSVIAQARRSSKGNRNSIPELTAVTNLTTNTKAITTGTGNHPHRLAKSVSASRFPVDTPIKHPHQYGRMSSRNSVPALSSQPNRNPVPASQQTRINQDRVNNNNKSRMINTHHNKNSNVCNNTNTPSRIPSGTHVSSAANNNNINHADDHLFKKPAAPVGYRHYRSSSHQQPPTYIQPLKNGGPNAGNVPRAANTPKGNPSGKRWFKHLQDSAQNYDNKDCRNNRRSQPPTALLPQHDHDQDQQQPQQPDGVDDGLDDADCADSSDSTILAATPTPAASNNNNTEPSSPETINQRTEHLRRKDLKIKQALEEKQHIIADILGIPREHFETLGDMAGESSGAAKEPRELVLAALYQANCLQDALNDALNIKESDIVAAKATAPSADKPASIASLPLYPAPMNKLMNIAGSLSQQLNLLLNIVSERDDERDRMRRELVASRERLHQLHMSQSSSPAGGNITSSATPTNSRPSSLLSQGSTVELGKEDDAAFTGHTHEEERTRTCSVQEELSQVLHRETSREDKREGAADESGCPSQQPEAASADTTTDRGGDADATSPSPNT